ncbi:sulfurtransferase [Domibacillus sp. A3M-37]|uniref:sulfurtransferase n=1 Tax=Domibacillus sp. A3M-37 TaxID=2962037 RepID=UPI0020B83352|nr:sulfurtransferase [Domibacillus sp. A3M-37]MCP3763141.1 sulfurtransferase [Domibacillus sp. A3M-37]
MIVTTDWLNEKIEQVVVFDCRFNLADPAEGAALYEHSHIPGAYYAHLDHHLSGEKGKGGGRHPLPDMNVFGAFMESCGVSDDTIVVAYDDGVSMFAGRLWWLLTYAGHKNVCIVDGGFSAWMKEGLPVTAERPERRTGQLTLHLQHSMIATVDEVAAGNTLLMDSRAPERYLGETEPLDRVPGHIPGAINRFFAEAMENGRWKPASEQKKRFTGIQADEPVIVYCGSGVSATPNIIALKQAGYNNVKLYPGSYSDWSNDKSRPIETERRDIHDE